jgi:hypothetical protein
MHHLEEPWMLARAALLHVTHQRFTYAASAACRHGRDALELQARSFDTKPAGTAGDAALTRQKLAGSATTHFAAIETVAL